MAAAGRKREFDSQLEMAMLNAELKQLGEYETVFCDNPGPGDFTFHIQMPDGSLTGRYGGVWGFDRDAAYRYKDDALNTMESLVKRREPCRNCERPIWRVG